MATGDEKLVNAVLDDYRSAPISEKLRAMLAFLDQQTTYQPSHFSQIRIARDQVVTMQYDAPGPLGLNGP